MNSLELINLGSTDPAPFSERDWAESEELPGLMHHLPSGCAFYVFSKKDPQLGFLLNPGDCGAVLVDSHEEIADGDEFIQRGYEAITALLTKRGYWAANVPRRPKPCRVFHIKVSRR
jgi:hypothetical protein